MEACRKIFLSVAARRLLAHQRPVSRDLNRPLATSGVRSQQPALAEDLDEEVVPEPKIKEVHKSSENTICITFNDSTKCLFNSTWLRDSCKCQACVDPPTQEKRLNSASIDVNIQPLSWDVDPSADRLEIYWPQVARKPPHASTYTAEWLHQFAGLFQPKEASAPPAVARTAAPIPQHTDITDEAYTNTRSSVILWNRDEIEENPPELEYEEFMETRVGLKKMLKNVCKFGISVLRGVPVNEHQIKTVARRMGYIRETGYGKTYDLKYDPDPRTHLSYTGLEFGHHTDLAYRERAPGVQLLHCLKSADPSTARENAGGRSFFVDGFYVAQWLRYNYPSHFNLLASTPVTFSFLDSQRDRWFRETWPVISVDHLGKLKDVHYSLFSMRPPLLPQNEVAEYYEALRTFAKRVEQSTLQYSFYLTPGDVVVLNNRRILHGRTAYDPTKVERHLKGCYMDLDEIRSLYEKMRKDDHL